MAYCTAAELKTFLGAAGSGDDALLTALISRAQAWIERYTERKFEAAADAVHRFSVGSDTAGRLLYLDGDLCAITTIVTNADGGDSAVTLQTSDYITYPRNSTPYYAVELKAGSGKEWDYTAEPADGVTVTGRWVYSTTPPDDIKQACIRLAAYLYKQRDAQVFDVTAQPDAGVITVPKGIPADVKLLIEGYRRIV